MGLRFSIVSVAPLLDDAIAEARRLRIPEFLVPSLPAGFSSLVRIEHITPGSQMDGSLLTQGDFVTAVTVREAAPSRRRKTVKNLDFPTFFALLLERKHRHQADGNAPDMFIELSVQKFVLPQPVRRFFF